jgi:hypothetical protein
MKNKEPRGRVLGQRRGQATRMRLTVSMNFSGSETLTSKRR